MAQIFHRSTNTLSRVTIFGAVFIAGFVLWVIGGIVRSPYVTNQGIAREQPVPFSHQHHVAGLGIDCRYCHTSVEKSNFAGVPPTQTCMNCHAQIWTNADMLAPVRDSFAKRSRRSHEGSRSSRRTRCFSGGAGIDIFPCVNSIARSPTSRAAAPLTARSTASGTTSVSSNTSEETLLTRPHRSPRRSRCLCSRGCCG